MPWLSWGKDGHSIRNVEQYGRPGTSTQSLVGVATRV